MQPGPTGDYPRGKLNQHDEGGLKISIAMQDGAIIIDFGKSIKWIGLDKETAMSLIDAIEERLKFM